MAATDEKLLKGAKYASNSLAGLSILALIGTYVVWGMSLELSRSVAPVAALGMFFIAASFAVLSVAARRGSLRAVEIAMLFLALHIGYNCITYVTHGQSHEKGLRDLPFALVFLPLMIIVLASNWLTLNKFKRRNLWQSAFGSAKPSRNFCITGGILMTAGFLLLNGSIEVGPANFRRNAEARNAKINNSIGAVNEKTTAVMRSVHEFSTKQDTESHAKVVAKADELVKALDTLREETKDIEDIQVVLRSYSIAAAKWKAGAELLRTAPDRANEFFKQGNDSYKRALRDLANYFPPKIGIK